MIRGQSPWTKPPGGRGQEGDPELDPLLAQALAPASRQEERAELDDLAALGHSIRAALESAAAPAAAQATTAETVIYGPAATAAAAAAPGDDRPTSARLTPAQAPAARRPPSMAAPTGVPTLWLQGHNRTYEVHSSGSSLLLGRDGACDVAIKDLSVSRKHAELQYWEGAWLISDLGSKGGTLVNGAPATKPTRLAEGDQVTLGGATFTVWLPAAPSREAAAPSPQAREPDFAAEEAPPAGVAQEGVGGEARGAEAGVGAATTGVPATAGAEVAVRQGQASVTLRRGVPEDVKEMAQLKRLGLVAGGVVAVLVVGGVLWRSMRPQPLPPTRVAERRTRPEAEPAPVEAPTAAAPAPIVRQPATPPKVQPPPPVAEKRALPQPPAPPEKAAQPVAQPEPKAPAPASIEPVVREPEGFVAPKPDQLPLPPGPLPPEVSPYEPRWFAGPGQATVRFRQSGELKGEFKIENDTVVASKGTVTAAFPFADIQEFIWAGSKNFPAPDSLYALGLYGQAAESYAQILREARASLLAAGQGADRDFPGRWYLEGRLNECHLKADHLNYSRIVLLHQEMATPEQVNEAARNFIRASLPGRVDAEAKAAVDKLVSAEKLKLTSVERKRWEMLKTGPIAVAAAPVPAVPPALPVPTPEKTVPAAPAPPPSPPVPLAAAKAQGPGPALRPALTALTYVGGTGDQYIHEVGFTPEGNIYGKGTGFTVTYSKDGSACLGIQGDANTPGGGPRGAGWANPGTTITCNGVSLTLGYKQVHPILQQPYLASSAGWNWWGWSHDQARARALMADSRGVALYALPDGRFLAKCWCDGGNTVLERDPRNLDARNPALANAYNRCAAGSGSLYVIGDAKTGEPLHATWMIHRPQAEAVDQYGRIYIAQRAARKFGPVHHDSLGLGGGAGVSIFNQALSECMFSATLGGDTAYALAVRDNMLVLGGSIGYQPKGKGFTGVSDGSGGAGGSDTVGPVGGAGGGGLGGGFGGGRATKAAAPPPRNVAKLPLLNPAQPQPGGGEDGFLAIVRLW